MATTYKLVLIRHGQSTWNLENRFTGWTDVDLSELGRQEAAAGAKLLRDEGFTFDVAYTSVLKRAIKTLWIVLEALELEWISVTRAWQLNERHYGAGQAVLIAGHGNSIRALVKYLDSISDQDSPELNIPTGIPLLYELDADLKPISHRYLADEETVRAATAAVANQARAR